MSSSDFIRHYFPPPYIADQSSIASKRARKVYYITTSFWIAVGILLLRGTSNLLNIPVVWDIYNSILSSVEMVGRRYAQLEAVSEGYGEAYIIILTCFLCIFFVGSFVQSLILGIDIFSMPLSKYKPVGFAEIRGTLFIMMALVAVAYLFFGYDADLGSSKYIGMGAIYLPVPFFVLTVMFSIMFNAFFLAPFALLMKIIRQGGALSNG